MKINTRRFQLSRSVNFSNPEPSFSTGRILHERTRAYPAAHSADRTRHTWEPFRLLRYSNSGTSYASRMHNIRALVGSLNGAQSLRILARLLSSRYFSTPSVPANRFICPRSSSSLSPSPSLQSRAKILYIYYRVV